MTTQPQPIIVDEHYILGLYGAYLSTGATRNPVMAGIAATLVPENVSREFLIGIVSAMYPIARLDGPAQLHDLLDELHAHTESLPGEIAKGWNAGIELLEEALVTEVIDEEMAVGLAPFIAGRAAELYA